MGQKAHIFEREGVLQRSLRKGDGNGDGTVDFDDAIIALQIAMGMGGSDPFYMNADTNGNSKIGMYDVIYILQDVAGLR